ncbi:DUF1036 domain-containing protein [Streptomyces sp. N2-109]|uniref:DUF1036 domain-containing protein n=1 Tax=Streptomyces gossypii TaxID=2883101 RepID=A0ABT2JKU9_9ACTN|nr:DUF1036 domain-containing protein [Streptomyces gossypii]MCT2588500.1 DUF1036 domain-containing protein [Streptomyces gossypii]
MALIFRNDYSRPIWAMYERYRPNCPDGGNWLKAGWWKIQPGQTAVVFAGDPHGVNPIWYAYAHSDDGLEWSDRFQELVPVRAFEWCSNVADTSSRTILMHEFVAASTNHTHTFRAP